MRCNSAKIAAIFSSWWIQESDYVVCAGFDEDLIRAGIGYLEQIHVFTSDTSANDGILLNELGKIFSPFSAILFTPSTSIPIPTFKKDGNIRNFNELVLSSASKFLDAGSSATFLPTIISLAQNKPHDDSLGALSNGGNGGGSGDSGQGGNSDGDRKEGDDSHREDCMEGGSSDDDPSGDDPEGPDKSGQSIHHSEVSFDVVSMICHHDSHTDAQLGANEQVFQDLHLVGALKVTVSTHLKVYLLSIYIFGLRHGRLRLSRHTLGATSEHAKSILLN